MVESHKKIKNIESNNRKSKKYRLLTDSNIKYAVFEEKDLNTRYFMYFVKKYCLSNGIKFDIKNFDNKEFTDWIHEYIQITNDYAKFLTSYDIDLNCPSLAETGKGKFDSIIGPEASEISIFSEIMERPKIIFGDVEKGLLIHDNRRIITLDDLNIDTLITQNPNFFTEVEDFTTFANSLNKNITFGVYGNFSDKDIKNKTNMIKRLLENTSDTIFEYDTFKDCFYMLVTTRRQKIKTKTLSL